MPSLTHMLCDFGLRGELVGCTTFCILPVGLSKTAALIGGTKDPDLAAITALRPTHILVNEEENKPEHIQACQALAPTFVSFPKAPADVPGLLREAGAFLGVEALAETKAAAAAEALAELRRAVRAARAGGHWPEQGFLYYIWREPYMLAGADSYISAMLAEAGLRNAAPGGDRYPTVPVEKARALAPDLLLLSSEPYPFRKRDAERLAHEWPGAPPMRWIDGQLLSWYGTLTQEALHALAAWVRGEPTALSRPF